MDACKSLTISPCRLEGTVDISGAKNSALRLLAASLLTDRPVTLNNYPAGLLDARVHVEMLEALGKTTQLTGEDVIIISENARLSGKLEWNGRPIRNTLLILGALTARTGEGAVPLPGGCKLGERKYDLHVMLLEALGARVWEESLVCDSPQPGPSRRPECSHWTYSYFPTPQPPRTPGRPY